MGLTTVVKDYGTDILDAIRDNDLKKLRSILEKQLRTDQKIQALCTTDIRHRPTKKFACPLILAARQEDPTIIQYMLNRGVDPNFVHQTVYTSKRRESVTALHIAVDLTFYATVEALLNANANPNIADHNGETSLHIAIKKADRVLTRMLLSKGADPSIADRFENAPLHIATLFGHLQLVKTLLKFDADVYQRGASGAIASHIAAREGHIHLIQVFCARDAGNINVKIPCYTGSREVAPLHLAAENGHVETVIALLDQFHAEVNLLDSEKNTALHCVVLQPFNQYRMRDRDFFYATAKVLVRYRVAINEKNCRGDTALHLAAAHHHPKIVELLLNVGANPFIENNDRAKPVDVVPDSDSVTRQLLKSAMANPRPPVMDASMISIQHDLQNLSMMPGVNLPGLGPRNQSTLRASARHHMPGVVNGSLLRRSISNTSTAQGSEVKLRHSHRQSSNADKRHSRHHSMDHNSEIALYTNVNKIDSAVVPGLNILSPISPIEPVNISSKPGHSSARELKSRDDPHQKSGRHSRSNNHSHSHSHSHRFSSESTNATVAVNQPNYVNEKNIKNRERNLPQSNDKKSPGHSSKQNQSFDGTSRKIREHRRSVSADRHSRSFTEDPNGSRRRKDKSHRNVPLRKSYDNILDDAEEDEAGVRVHTIPGKPSTIAVEYAGGPIVISVDAKNDSFNGDHHGIDYSINRESESDVSSVERSPRRKEHHKHDRKKTKKDKQEKTKQKKHSRKFSDDEEEDDDDDDDDDGEECLTSPAKSDFSRKPTGEPIYTNQSQIQEEKQRLEEHLRFQEEQKRMEEQRANLNADIRRQEKEERRRQRREERELRRAKKREENERRRAKKLQRRLQRQDIQEPEAPVVLDAKPTVVYPTEVLNQSDYDSDELVTEQLMTLRSVKQKATEIAESLIRKWTDAEDDEDDLSSGRGDRVGFGTAARQRKPPRPGLSDGDDSRSGLDESRASLDLPPIPTPTPRSSLVGSTQSDVGGRPKFETSVRELVNEVKIERATVSMVLEKGPSTRPDTSDQTRWVDAKVVEKVEHFAEEPIPSDSVTHHPSTSVEEGTLVMRSADSPTVHRAGLKLRVAGEVPKAYSRADKDSARKAFILAPPVGIESSSEASDSEASLSRSGTAEGLAERLQQVKAETLQMLRAANSSPGQGNDQGQPGTKSGSRPSASVRYAQPYKSFGKIEPQTDALEEAMWEHTVELKVEELWKQQSKVASNVAQIPHQQMSKPASKNDTVEEDSFSSGSDTDEENRDYIKSVVKDARRNEDLIKPKKVVGTPTCLTGIISRPDLLLKTTKSSKQKNKDLSRSSDALSFGDDLEQYEEEPSFRRPGSRSFSRSSDVELEFSDQEPTGRKSRGAVEDDEVAMINDKNKSRKSKRSQETEISSNGVVSINAGVQKGGKQKKTKQGDSRKLNEDLVELEEEMRYKSGSIPNSKSLSVDVWKEAMAGRPLASSEAFELPVAKSRNAIAKGHRPDAKERSDLQWNKHLLSGDDDLSKETLEDLSYSSYIMSQNLAANGWDENIDETNLDDFVADNESPIKVLQVRPRDTTTSVVGRRRQRAQADMSTIPDVVTKKSREKQQAAVVDMDDDTMRHQEEEELKPRRSRAKDTAVREQRRSSGATIAITAVDANNVSTDIHGDVMLDDDDDDGDEGLYQNDQSRLSASGSVQLWEDKDDDSDEEHMYAYIDSDMERLPSSTSLNRNWSIDSSAGSKRQPMGPGGKPLPLPKPPHLSAGTGPQAPIRRSLQPPISPARTFDPRPEPDDMKSTEWPSRLDSLKSFVRGDPGTFHRRSRVTRTERRTHQYSQDAYMSESEVSRRRPTREVPSNADDAYAANQKRLLRFGSRDIYSEAEASDFEGPPELTPGKSVKQSALEALQSRPLKRRKYQSMILIHPGHHDKNFNHIRRMLRPKQKRVPGLTCVPSVGRYGDSALDSRDRTPSRYQSGTETEPEDASMIDITQYDIIAKLWMERLRAQSVQKCSTMFLSLLPPNAELPKELTAGYRQSTSTSNDDQALPPQWVMARSRTMNVRQLLRQNGGHLLEEELKAIQSSSPHRQSVLFFKVGGNWMDMAWVLFDGLQSDSETVRMIRDIQLKNPNGLSEQMHDLMHRWWSRKGRSATIEELRRVLDIVHIAYIKEEFNDVRASVIPYSDTEDDLDVGEISDANPNVTRLIQEYEIRSLNVTMNVDSSAPPLPLNPPPPVFSSEDVVMRHLKQKVARAERQKSGFSSEADAGAAELRPTSRDKAELSYDLLGQESGSEDKKRTAVVHPQPASSLRKVSNL